MRGMRSAVLGATMAAIFLGASSAAQAATIPVTSNADDNGAGCTLREGIASANANADQGGCVGTNFPNPTVYGDDVIKFAAASTGQVIQLNAELVIDPALAGTLLIDGSDVGNG